MARTGWIFGLLVVAALAGGLTAYLQGGEETPAADPGIGIARPHFAFHDLEGRVREASEWDGRVLLVNFWAPWCPPCRNEIPAFVSLQERYGQKGLTVVGITIDTADNARDFADTHGINYPILIGEEAGVEIAYAYGNRVGALPFTAVVDRQGVVRSTHRKELSFEEAEALIKPLL